MRQTPNASRASKTSGTKVADELRRAKYALVAARASGEAHALARVLASYPRHVAALVEFDAALLASASYDAEQPTPATEAVAGRAYARALAAVFPEVPAAVAAAQVVPAAPASLRALRAARQLTMKGAADHLGLGVDVVSALEAGHIAASSVPRRLLHALADLLGTAADQVAAALQGQPALAPALQRSKSGARKEAPTSPSLEFAEAVRLSPGMTEEQKAAWLGEA